MRRPSRTIVTSLVAASSRRIDVLGGRRGRVLDVEQLAVDAVGRHVELAEDLLGIDDHPVRSAQPPVVDVGDRHSAGSSTAQLGRVETTAEQLRLPRLARQHVDQLDPRRIAILEVGELVGEHHRVRAPVAVEHRDPCWPGLASTDETIDSAGVIPEPATISTWWPATSTSGVKLPLGACTSMRSPGRTSRTSHVETAPSGTSRTPIRGDAPAGAQIEYERRCSTPSTNRRSVTHWPGRKAYSLGELGRDVERDGDGVAAQLGDLGDGE